MWLIWSTALLPNPSMEVHATLRTTMGPMQVCAVIISMASLIFASAKLQDNGVIYETRLQQSKKGTGQILSQQQLEDSLIDCLEAAGVTNYTRPGSPAFYELLDFSAQNLRFREAEVAGPRVLILPRAAEEVRVAYVCVVEGGFEFRVRSGGHDYEGLSYSDQAGGAAVPSSDPAGFVVIDMMNLQRVDVDAESATAWAQTGVTLGQLYVAISKVLPEHAFPAGVCPTVGAGGHIGGGGYGFLSRRHGLSADNVLDALLVDPSGRLVDRAAMGKDHFWALRGGGGGSWGIVVAWKLRLVHVGGMVTAINTYRTEGVAELVEAWQVVAAKAAPEELLLAVFLRGGRGEGLVAAVYGYYLGATREETMDVVGRIFPELGLTWEETSEGSWLEAAAVVGRVNGTAGLADRFNIAKLSFKAKSDYVQEPLPLSAVRGALSLITAASPFTGTLWLAPFGGFMSRVPPGRLPFSHRAGILYMIQYRAQWPSNTSSPDAAMLAWSRRMYDYMEPFVSRNPRLAYVNYLDLDLGTNATFEGAAATWGRSYFGDANFRRLARIKARVDPRNLFHHPQSMPLLLEEDDDCNSYAVGVANVQ